MKDFKTRKRFLTALARSLARLAPARAPAGFADRVMSAIAEAPAADLWSYRPAFAAAGALLVLSLFPWSHRSSTPAPAGARPEIVSFTVDKTVVTPAQPITLSWRVRNAKKVLLEDGTGTTIEAHADSLTMYLRKPGHYDFVLVALGADGSSLSKELQENP